eukprot:765191-Hanusia_phi.AAC.5
MRATVPPIATNPPMIGPQVVTPSVAADRKWVAGPDPVTLFAPSRGSSIGCSLAGVGAASSWLEGNTCQEEEERHQKVRREKGREKEGGGRGREGGREGGKAEGRKRSPCPHRLFQVAKRRTFLKHGG